MGEVVRANWHESVGWQDRAACRSADPNLFFSPQHLEDRSERRAREARAKEICEGCPVLGACLTFAIDTNEPHGIWGGMNEGERRRSVEKRAG
ncbi:MAG: WhiB family transcriptional regulator [Actinomycetota bacterium]